MIGAVRVYHQAQVDGFLLGVRAVGARKPDEEKFVVTDRRQTRQQRRVDRMISKPRLIATKGRHQAAVVGDVLGQRLTTVDDSSVKQLFRILVDETFGFCFERLDDRGWPPRRFFSVRVVKSAGVVKSMQKLEL